MKLSKKHLKRIIAEEVGRVLFEMDYLNDHTGEVTWVPPDQVQAISQELGIDMSQRYKGDPETGLLGDEEFSRVYRWLASKEPKKPTLEEREEAAVRELADMARVAAEDYVGDNPEADAGVLYDLASGLEHMVDSETWEDALAYFDFDDDALVSHLSEAMYEVWP